MNTEESAKKAKNVFWSFCPLEFFECLDMTNEQAGKIFKSVIGQLIRNNVPENSMAYPMYQRTNDYRRKKVAAANKRWENSKPKDPIPLPRNKQEVIDYAEDNSLDVDDALEWAQINLKDRGGKDKDGNPIRNWKMACSAYCAAMQNKRNS